MKQAGRICWLLLFSHIYHIYVDDILNRVERGLLQPYYPELVDLHTVEGVLERVTSRSATSGFNVSRITSTLHWERMRQQTSTQAWIIGVTALTLSLLIFIFIYFRFCNQPCSYVRKYVRIPERKHPSLLSPPNAVELKDNAVKLQTQPCESAEDQETVQQEATDSDNSQPLTQFSRHVVLPTDAWWADPQCTSADTSVLLVPKLTLVVFNAHTLNTPGV
jgi:hypothetical protein